MKVLALVDRDSGKARTMVIEDVNAETIMAIVIANVSREVRIMTDEAIYGGLWVGVRHFGYNEPLPILALCEPFRDCRRPFDVNYAVMGVSSSMAW